MESNYWLPRWGKRPEKVPDFIPDEEELTMDNLAERLSKQTPPPVEAAQASLWQRALDLIEWANDLRMGSRPDLDEWGEERKAFYDAVAGQIEDEPVQ